MSLVHPAMIIEHWVTLPRQDFGDLCSERWTLDDPAETRDCWGGGMDQHLNISGFCGLVYMLQQIKHGFISRVCLSLASVWHLHLQNCHSWSCTQMISLLFIAAGAATVFWLQLYSLSPWFLYIWLAGAMLFRWAASPPINVLCYTISYIVRYHFHKSLLVDSFLLPLGIVPAIICILFCKAS